MTFVISSMEFLCDPALYDGADDLAVVIALVFLVVCMEQLVDDIGIFLRKSSSYLGSGVLGGYCLADQYQTHDGFLTPLIKIQLRIFLPVA